MHNKQGKNLILFWVTESTVGCSWEFSWDQTTWQVCGNAEDFFPVWFLQQVSTSWGEIRDGRLLKEKKMKFSSYNFGRVHFFINWTEALFYPLYKIFLHVNYWID